MISRRRALRGSAFDLNTGYSTQFTLRNSMDGLIMWCKFVLISTWFVKFVMHWSTQTYLWFLLMEHQLLQRTEHIQSAPVCQTGCVDNNKKNTWEKWLWNVSKLKLTNKQLFFFWQIHIYNQDSNQCTSWWFWTDFLNYKIIKS